MPVAFEDLKRADTDLVVMHDLVSWREFHELALRHAGFGVTTYTTHPDSLAEHLNHNGSRRADLIVFGIQPSLESSWDNLRQLRDIYNGPVLATTEVHNLEVRKRAHEMGVQDYLAIGDFGDFGEEGLELKVETVLTAYRINAMILENDLRIQRLFVNILTVMVKILESKDPYTRFHSHSVTKWSRMIGRRKGLCDEDIDRLGVAALLHDFGKIGIPENILCKATRLTSEEFEIMKKHPTIARNLLSSIELLSDVLSAITHHHERWDGRGYPDGLKGEQTPLWGRIISLADSYDTMMSRRTYKEPYSQERIRQELDNGRGTQFDPELVDLFRAILDEHVVNLPPGG